MRMVQIPLADLIPTHVCACPNPEHELTMAYAVVCIVLSE